MKKILLFVLIISGFSISNAQVGINILEPDSSAILHLESTDKGLLLPRLTTAQMTGISNPVNGLTVYNTEDSLLYYYNNECWLKAYQKTCNDCEFVASLSSPTGVIDHVTSDSVTFDVNVLQTNGNTDIAVSFIFLPPTGMSIDIDNAVIDSAGAATFSINASIFTAPGTYPIVIQVSCDAEVRFLTYILELESCIEVDIAADGDNIDLFDDFGPTFGLPGQNDPPECIILDVFTGVEISSTDPLLPALTWGTGLNSASHVGFINNGSILARGGDGASLGNLLNLGFVDDGGDGGNALELTTKTTFLNNGPIYAGGGGGGGIGSALDLVLFTIPSIPFIFPGSDVGFCLAAGSGGGGGSAGGAGGGLSGACNGSGTFYFELSFVEDGDNATLGPNSIPGEGGEINETIPIPAIDLGGIATVTLTPFVLVEGGDGGDFGQPGTGGNGSAGVSYDVSVILIGSLINDQISLNLLSSSGGNPGLAVKTNSNQVIDLVTPSNLIIGDVQP